MGEYINLISAISNIECRINNYAEHSFGVGKKMQNKANDKIGKIAQALL